MDQAAVIIAAQWLLGQSDLERANFEQTDQNSSTPGFRPCDIR
jgi:hypothetical protein